MRCPKCSYERQPTDTVPEGECPTCGIIYAKFRPQTPTPRSAPASPPPSSSPQSFAHAEPMEPRTTKIPAWVIPAVVALVVGYFAGREHIKYELRQTFQAAAEGVTKSFGAALGGKETEQKKESPLAKPKEPAPLSVTLNRKSFREANYSAGVQDAITFAVTFNNLTGKDIRAFDGTLTFTDLLENQILSAGLAINDPVSSGSQLEWSGELAYNQFIDRHQRLRNEDFQNLKIRFYTKKILFSDGSVKEFE